MNRYVVETLHQGYVMGCLCLPGNDFSRWGHNVGGIFPAHVFDCKEDATAAAAEYEGCHISFRCRVVPAPEGVAEDGAGR